MGARVLIAEDDQKQAELIRAYLAHDGHIVHVVGDGHSAIAEFRSYRPDLIVLDVMLPSLSGLDVCALLRRESEVPILFLTARAAEDDLLAGLDIGADDYVTKPFSPRELTARVRSLLRRARAGQDRSDVITVGDLIIDTGRFLVSVGDRRVSLTAKEFDILQVLASAPGRVFTRGQILRRAFGDDRYVEQRTVDAHVTNLRRKIEPDPANPKYIQTVYGRGYRMSEPR